MALLLPTGVCFESYLQRRAYIHTRPQWACFIAFLLLFAWLPFFAGTQITGLISMMSIVVVAVVGLQIVTGYAGLINLGQSAFMGIGAYVAASLSINFHLPFFATIFFGGLGGALLGLFFGLPVMRMKGYYLGLSTLAAQVAFPLIIMALPVGLFGGALGLRIEPARFFGITLSSDRSLYYFNMILSCIMVFLAFNLVRTRVGRAFMAIRDNEIAAELIGINIFFYKTLAFVISAFYAGVAGCLWVYSVRYVGADQFTLFFSIWYMGMVIVGGPGSILGGIFGTIFLRGLQEIITYLGPFLIKVFPQIGGSEFWFASMNILLGSIIILFLIFEPRGLAQTWNILKISYRIWPFRYMK
jgi:branched-chain amino acid transport system permease protein